MKKKRLFWLITIGCLAVAYGAGRWLHLEALARATSAPITTGDEIGCYIAGLSAGALVWVLLLSKADIDL